MFTTHPRLARAASVFLMASAPVAIRADEGERVTFNTDDGQHLTGRYFKPATSAGTGQPIVILLHENRGSWENWQPFIAACEAADFATLAIDLRGHGESATPKTREQVENRDVSLYAAMDQDVWAAYDWIAKQPDVDRSRVALVGASVGCSVALRYATRDWSVDAIACLSPGESYLGLDSKSDAKNLVGRKVLFVASEEEKAACKTLSPLIDGSAVKIVPETGHGTDLFKSVRDLDKQLVRFIKESVGPASSDPVFCTIKSGGRVFHAKGSGWIEKINPTNLRVLSSAEEALARGLRAARSRGPGATDMNGDDARPDNKQGDGKSPKKPDRSAERKDGSKKKPR